MNNDIKQLVAKAKRLDELSENCEHSFKPQGMSKIAHPELAWNPRQHVPNNVKTLSDIKYASWFCEKCGLRVSTEDYHKLNNEKFAKQRDLEEHAELNRKYKVTD